MNPVARLLRFIITNRDIIGVMDGSLAFQAPQIVQLDLTNRCNNDCIACWCRSPLLGDKALPLELQEQSLTFEAAKSLLADLATLGCQAIFLAGSGEPMMYPQILAIIQAIKTYGMRCYLNTNFTLVDETTAQFFCTCELDELTVSLWAATPETYSLTHPNKTPADYEHLLMVLSALNKYRNGGLPRVKLYHVISNLNYHEVYAMAQQAADLGVETIEFTILDTIPGRTDSLLPNPEQAGNILRQCVEVQNTIAVRYPKLELSQFEVFQNRVTNLAKGQHDYDQGLVARIPCYIGWLFARVLPDGNVNSCLKAHRIPIGNIYATPFSELWNSNRQREFRRHTLAQQPGDPFFRGIGNDPDSNMGCLRSCDDIGRNACLHNRLLAMDWKRRQTLTLAAKLLRWRQQLGAILKPNRW